MTKDDIEEMESTLDRLHNDCRANVPDNGTRAVLRIVIRVLLRILADMKKHPTN